MSFHNCLQYSTRFRQSEAGHAGNVPGDQSAGRGAPGNTGLRVGLPWAAVRETPRPDLIDGLTPTPWSRMDSHPEPWSIAGFAHHLRRQSFLIFGASAESVVFISHRRRSPSTERSFLAAAAAGSLVFALFAGSTSMVLLLKEQDERALQESYDKYDVLFRSDLSAVFLSDPQTGVVLEANP